ncbi:hypothetical protein [Anaerosporobacter sp.]
MEFAHPADFYDTAPFLSNEKIVEFLMVSKQFIKGERLKYYPVGMNLYSASCGVKRPTVEEIAIYNGKYFKEISK